MSENQVNKRIKNFFLEVILYALFGLLFVVSFSLLSVENWNAGFGVIMAGSLLLPPVQRRLAMTPINSTGRIAACIFVILVITGMMGGSPSVTDSGAVFREVIRSSFFKSLNRSKVLGNGPIFKQRLVCCWICRMQMFSDILIRLVKN